MRLRAAAWVLSCFLTAGCAPRIDYFPAPGTPLTRAAIDRADVGVFSETRPDWNYAEVGRFQEARRDSVPGGPPGFATLLRERGAEEGCAGVILGGRVSMFEGNYRMWSPRRGRSDPLHRHLVPIFIELGREATCLVRTDTPTRPRTTPSEWTPAPQRFFSFGGNE